MNSEFRLLIVEDDENEITNYNDSIELFNESNTENNFKIKVEFKSNLDNGISAVKDNRYDGAIIDLRLKQDNFEEAEGNKIIKDIVGKLRIPIIVISGFLGDLDPEFQNSEGLLKFYDRGDVEIIDVLNHFKKIYNTGITKILGEDGFITRELTKIFWERISSNLDYWISESDNNIKTEKVVSRYIINHLREGLEVNDNGEFEVYHSSEFYIVPPIKQNLFTGDILEKDNIRKG